MRPFRTLLLVLLVSGLLLPVAATAQDPTPPPTTEFEDNGGADWTSFDAEQSFLTAVDAASTASRSRRSAGRSRTVPSSS